MADPSASTGSASTTSSATVIATTTLNSKPSSSSVLSTGAKAGIGAGVGGVALVAVMVAASWYVRRKKQRIRSQPQVSEQKHTTEATLYSRNSELQVTSSGKDYLGPTPGQELESSSPSRTHTDTKSSTTVIKMA